MSSKIILLLSLLLLTACNAQPTAMAPALVQKIVALCEETEGCEVMLWNETSSQFVIYLDESTTFGGITFEFCSSVNKRDAAKVIVDGGDSRRILVGDVIKLPAVDDAFLKIGACRFVVDGKGNILILNNFEDL